MWLTRLLAGVPRWLWILAGLVFVVGVYWRWVYLFDIHPPTEFVYSDMNSYVRAAKRFYDPEITLGIADTVRPPGMGYWLGLAYELDNSWTLAVNVQFVVACLVPLLMLGIGWELFGARVGLLSLMGGSLYFPFIDYAGYWLAEAPFTFGLLLLMWLLIRILRMKNGWLAFTVAVFAGLVMGGNAALKSVTLLSAAIVAIPLAVNAARTRSRRFLVLAAGLVIGLSVVLAGLQKRCTNLKEGEFCLIANEAALNFYLGHQGRIRHVRFIDRERNIHHIFGCPVAAQNGYQPKLVVHVGAYDSEALSDLAWKWIKENPTEAFLLSVEHVFESFAGSVAWPTAGQKQRRWSIFFQQLYWVLILIPGIIHVYNRRRPMWRLRAEALPELLMLLPLFGMIVAAFVAKGEPRYRIPFDSFMIVLAARFFTRDAHTKLAALFARRAPPEPA